jgi:hypothetical protein
MTGIKKKKKIIMTGSSSGARSREYSVHTATRKALIVTGDATPQLMEITWTWKKSCSQQCPAGCAAALHKSTRCTQPEELAGRAPHTV